LYNVLWIGTVKRLMDKIYLSERANPMMVEYLKTLGYEISLVAATTRTYFPVNSHPDIYMCAMSRHEIFHGDPALIGFNYPHNIRYNAVCMGEHFIHNLKYTDEKLLSLARSLGKIPVNVRQGYTKCNMAVIDENSAVTSDQGVLKSLANTGIDLLAVSPGHVLLTGQPCGFLGGASGKVGDEMIFHGNLSAHPDFIRIADFVKSRGCGLKYFEQFELEDIGSIIEA